MCRNFQATKSEIFLLSGSLLHEKIVFYVFECLALFFFGFECLNIPSSYNNVSCKHKFSLKDVAVWSKHSNYIFFI